MIRSGVALSYDEGRSFRYFLGGPYDTSCAFVTARDEFVFLRKEAAAPTGPRGCIVWYPIRGIDGPKQPFEPDSPGHYHKFPCNAQ